MRPDPRSVPEVGAPLITPSPPRPEPRSPLAMRLELRSVAGLRSNPRGALDTRETSPVAVKAETGVVTATREAEIARAAMRLEKVLVIEKSSVSMS